jgi:membrane protease YdiL (CAAX protease family)
MTGRRRRSRLRGRLDRVLPRPLFHVVAQELPETAAVVRRRRRMVAGTVVAGAGLLGASLSTRPGSREFYLSTATVAGVWTAGGLASGPLHLGWIENRDSTLRRPVLTPVATGVGAFGLFYAAALVARRIPVLDAAVSRVLLFADEGENRWVVLTTLANGLGEEIFFRGALYAALGDRHPVAASTAVYTVATTTTRNPALVLAAGVMGTLFGLQRRASGGVQAPTITHLTWSVLMVRFLPPLFRRPREPGAPDPRRSHD